MLRLRELRLANAMTMREAAQALGLPYTTYINYEKGVREVGPELIRKFADYYHVTSDYLIGRSDDPLSGLPDDRMSWYADPPSVSAAGFHLAALYDLASPRDKQLVETILSAYEEKYYGR